MYLYSQTQSGTEVDFGEVLLVIVDDGSLNVTKRGVLVGITTDENGGNMIATLAVNPGEGNATENSVGDRYNFAQMNLVAVVKPVR